MGPLRNTHPAFPARGGPLPTSTARHGSPSWSQVSQPFGTQLTGTGKQLTAAFAIQYSRAGVRSRTALDQLGKSPQIPGATHTSVR